MIYNINFFQKKIPFVFIHINKTGGSSIEEALNLKLEHKTAQEKLDELGEAEWRKNFTFTVVRNPWDKVVSHYFYRVSRNTTGLGDNPICFTEWVKLTYGEQNPQYYEQPKMFMPQINWIRGTNGKILVNFIGKFERLNEDYRKICKRIGRKNPANLPHLKKTNRGKYVNYYNAETKEIVSKWFREDIETFKYKFER